MMKENNACKTSYTSSVRQADSVMPPLCKGRGTKGSTTPQTAYAASSPYTGEPLVEGLGTKMEPCPLRLLRSHLSRSERLRFFDRLRMTSGGVSRKGKWLINPDGYFPYCSECKAEPEGRKMTKFCPECGADMRGEENVSEI